MGIVEGGDDRGHAQGLAEDDGELALGIRHPLSGMYSPYKTTNLLHWL
jgi:hypothetical protein